METHQLLGQLCGLHQMMGHLLMSVPKGDAYRRFHPELPPLAWLLGRCVYLETYWIREVVQQEENLLRLANPGMLPTHPLMAEQHLVPLLLQQQAVLVEQMLAQLSERQLQSEPPFQVTTPLVTTPWCSRPRRGHGTSSLGVNHVR